MWGTGPVKPSAPYSGRGGRRWSPARGLAAHLSAGSAVSWECTGPRAARVPPRVLDTVGPPRMQPRVGSSWMEAQRRPLGAHPWGWPPSPSSAHCPPLAVGSFCPNAHRHGGSCDFKGEWAPVAAWEPGAPGCFLKVMGATCGVGGAPSSGVGGMSLGSRGPHWWGRGSWDAGIGVPGGQQCLARGLPAAPP